MNLNDILTDDVVKQIERAVEGQCAADAGLSITQPLTQPILKKQDLRDVWLDENTTVTIDLEDLKEQMKRDFYKSVGLPGLEFGA